MALLLSAAVVFGRTGVAAAPPGSPTAPSANQLGFVTGVGTTQFITFNVCTFNDCEQDDLGGNHTFPAASFAPTATGKDDLDHIPGSFPPYLVNYNHRSPPWHPP